ncbi:CvpA family protein [Phenylobacterium sp.]|jgi:membrane protein required for colicin V production|uniref:CvpA family protein n=1 Tax=Phenylobacterium sp. TaxID=1871053 RepID=UPI002F3F6172
MTQFDYIVIAVLAISAIFGFIRGAAREVVTVLAFLLAAMAAMFGLRFAGPVARAAINPDWAGNVAAVVVVFLAVYITLRLLGAGLVRRVKDAEVLGTLDRSIGLGFGLVRALVLLGALNLAFNAATPPERVPAWISGAKLYPLTTASGRLLAAFAPKGMDLAGRLKPAFAKAADDGGGDSKAAGGYDARDRREIDDLVEKTR